MRKKINILTMFFLVGISANINISLFLNSSVVNLATKSLKKTKKLEVNTYEVASTSKAFSGFVLKNDYLYFEKFNWLFQFNINQKEKETPVINLGFKVSNLVMRGNKIYVSSDNKIYQVNLKNHKKVKIAELDSKVLALKLIGKYLIFSTLNDKIYHIDVNDPSMSEVIINLKSDYSNFQITSLEFAYNCLFGAALNGKIYKFDKLHDDIVEIADLDTRIYSLKFKAGKLYAGTKNKIYQINVNKKKKIKIANLQSPISYLTVENKQLYAVIQSGKVYKVIFN